MSKKTEDKKTTESTSETSHVSKVKPRPVMTAMGPYAGCRPSGET